MDSLIVIIVILLVVARFWKWIVAALAGLTATFLGGVLVGIITGGLTRGYLNRKYPDDPHDTPEEEDAQQHDVPPRVRCP